MSGGESDVSLYSNSSLQQDMAVARGGHVLHDELIHSRTLNTLLRHGTRIHRTPCGFAMVHGLRRMNRFQNPDLSQDLIYSLVTQPQATRFMGIEGRSTTGASPLVTEAWWR